MRGQRLWDAVIQVQIEQIDTNKYKEYFDPSKNPELRKLITTYTNLVYQKLIPLTKMSDKSVEITFSNGKKEKYSEIIIELNKKTTLDIVKAVLTKAASDTTTQKFVVGLAKMVMEDFQSIFPPAEGSSSVEDSVKEFDANYQKTVTELVYELDKIAPKIPPFTFQYRIRVDNKNNFKGERLYFYLKDSNNFKIMLNVDGVVNALDQPVKITKIDITKAVDFNKLSDKEQENITNKFLKILNLR